MPDLRDKVWEVLHATANRPTPVMVTALVRLINDEKSLSYGIGVQDGARKMRTTA